MFCHAFLAASKMQQSVQRFAGFRNGSACAPHAAPPLRDRKACFPDPTLTNVDRISGVFGSDFRLSPPTSGESSCTISAQICFSDSEAISFRFNHYGPN
jgi:hypothetical protein